MTFELKTIPLAKKRHRSFRRGVHICNYDPQADQKNMDREKLKQIMLSESYTMLFKCPIRAEMTFGIPYPQGMPKKRRTGQPVQKKPDIDNYAKYYLDCLNGIAFKDDNQVAELDAKKVYCDEPFVKIIIKQLQ